LVPPPDDNEHGCAWRDDAKHLEKKNAEDDARAQARMDAMQAELEVLKRAFARRTEKMGKMPKVPRPPRTPEEIAARRTEQAQLCANNVVTTQETLLGPAELRTCHLREGSSVRRVGTGKPSEPWSRMSGYFRRLIDRRETLSCRCGHIVKAPGARASRRATV
jgi:hypothetical protein